MSLFKILFFFETHREACLGHFYPKGKNEREVILGCYTSSYAAASATAPPAPDFCSRDNFHITFRISFIFGKIHSSDQ